MMGRKLKLVRMVQCPYHDCGNLSEFVLKVDEVPKIMVAPCEHCKRDMQVGLDLIVEVLPVPGWDRPREISPAPNFLEMDTSHSRISRAFGLTWHHGALVDGDDNGN